MSRVAGPDEGGRFIWDFWRGAECACGGSSSVLAFEPDFNGNKGVELRADVAPGSAVGVDGGLCLSGGDKGPSYPALRAASGTGFRIGSGVGAGNV